MFAVTVIIRIWKNYRKHVSVDNKMKSEIIVILFVSFLTTCFAQGTTMASTHSSDQYPLHEAAFKGEIQRLEQLLNQSECDVNRKDKHGNTALHLAVMLERVDVAKLLIHHGASVFIQNSSLLTPYRLGASVDMLDVLFRRDLEERKLEMQQKMPGKVRLLKGIKDFYMELKISLRVNAIFTEFNFPFIPTQVWKIYKKGSMLRVDLQMMDGETLRNLSFILYSKEPSIDKTFVVLDRERKIFKHIKYNKTDAEIKSVANLIMSLGNPQPRIITENLNFTKTQRTTKEKMDGAYSLEEYKISGFRLTYRSRKSQKSESSKNSTVSWEQYIAATPKMYPMLEKKQKFNDVKLNCGGKITVVKNFPLRTAEILEIFRVIAPIQLFETVCEILTNRLQADEFPLGIQFPVASIIKALYLPIPGLDKIKFIFADLRFQNYESQEIEEEEFEVPNDYVENLQLFPNL